MKRLFILAFLQVIIASLMGANNQMDLISLTLWSKYKILFLIVFVLFVLLIIIATILISNIVQKKKILKKLLRSEAQLRSISDNLVNGFIYQVDTGIDDSCRKFNYISNNTFQILGVSNEKIYNDAFELYRLLHPDDLVKLQKLEKVAFENKNILTFDGRIILENGIIKWFQLTSIPHQSENGHILWDGLAMDICKLKQIENELIIAKEKAEESTKLIASFLTNLSHEIRTPMNGILGFMELIKNSDITKEDKNFYLENYNQSAQRLLNTLDNIIEMSEIESDHVTFTKSKTNLQFIMNQVYDMFYDEANQKGLKLIWHNSNVDSQDFIETDSEKLYVILSNLIKNSLKFTDHGSIKYGYFIENELVHFYVKDTGSGIPSHALDTIFNSFIQADMNVNRIHEGIGLGLSIAKAYVEKLGGKIWSESVENEYSIFHFTLKKDLY